MNKLNKDRKRIKSKERAEEYRKLMAGEHEIDSRLLLIQQLIPIGLMAVEE